MLARERPLKGAKEEEEATDNGGSHLMAGLSAHASLICNGHTIHSFACSNKDLSRTHCELACTKHSQEGQIFKTKE